MSDETHEPLPLGFYLTMYRMAEARRVANLLSCEYARAFEYAILVGKIHSRIVRKYAIIDTLPDHTLRQLRERPAPSEPGSWRKAKGVLSDAAAK